MFVYWIHGEKELTSVKNSAHHLTFLFSLFLFLQRLFIHMVDHSTHLFQHLLCLLDSLLGPGNKQNKT